MDIFGPVVQQFLERLGLSAEYIWPYLVSYTRMVSLVNLVIDIAWMIAMAILIMRLMPLFTRNVWLYNHRNDEAYTSPEWHAVIYVLSAIGIVIAGINFLIAMSVVPDHFAGMMVPEARAILDIVKQVTKK